MSTPITPLPRYYDLPCCKCLAEGNTRNVCTGTGTTPPSLATWFVVATPAGVLTTPTAVVNISPPHSNWSPLTTPLPSLWVDDNGTGGTVFKQAGVWVYEMQVYVHKDCRIPYIRPPSISGRFLADNSGKLFLNKSTSPPPIAVTTGGSLGYQSPNAGVFTNVPLLLGQLNTIRVEVTNDADQPGPHGRPVGAQSGVNVSASISAGCDANPLVGSGTAGPPPQSA